MAGKHLVHGRTPEFALHRLQLSNEAEFQEIVAIYDEAFPESERKPAVALRCMLATANYHFLLATENDSAVGFAIVHVGNTAALLEYMAVASAQRGRGLGTRIVRAIEASVNAPERTLLLEVESDRIGHQDRTLQTRRKAFYRALGARELQGLRWIMPKVVSAQPPSMDMLAFTTANAVGKDQLRDWLTSIYVDVYGQNADDRRISIMLDGLPAEVLLV